MEEVDDISEGSDEDLYTGSQIFRRHPPTMHNANDFARNVLLTWWIEKNPNLIIKGTKYSKNQIWKIDCCKLPAFTK